MNDSDASGSAENFGPSPYFIGGAALETPFFWAGVLLGVFQYSSDARFWLWRSVSLGFLQREVVAFYYWLEALRYSLPGALVGLSVLYGLLRYGTSSYKLDSVGDLIVNTGLGGFGTKGGPFDEFQRTIPVAVVGEVNVRRNPIQFLFRTGTLFVTYRDLNADSHGHKGSETIELPYILKPEQVRDRIMSVSRVHAARFIV
jgi:hypothetical protein